MVLIFLIITTTYTKQSELQINLPTADSAKPAERVEQIDIAVDATGKYVVNKTALTYSTREAFAEHQQAANRDALLAKLTGREAQVLERIVAGRLNKQIADQLNLSLITVKIHRGNMMKKMRAKNFAELVQMAGQLGLNKS